LLSIELRVNRRAFLDENGESPNIFGGLKVLGSWPGAKSQLPSLPAQSIDATPAKSADRTKLLAGK
jgi:hypothetical protein